MVVRELYEVYREIICGGVWLFSSVRFDKVEYRKMGRRIREGIYEWR